MRIRKIAVLAIATGAAMAASATPANAQSICADLDVNINGTQLVDQAICLPPAAPVAQQRSSARSSTCLINLRLALGGRVLINQPICIGSRQLRKAGRSRSRNACIRVTIALGPAGAVTRELCLPPAKWRAIARRA